ncbi:uncharacterized protein LOC122509911 [Leptopilina heterotoma]|uniref:uncharacterized protein LOC122509911 n=1 Tax=Leptopilina heterotoma TaxID=63436 RepID=UPI001CA98D1B|nr:uncharacterized protein LOC122509911 [Leptopilina heterotoma]XP_043480170.1 uncharacterized protein LOC122509911 [Leptopilina heterotoma]
MKTRGFSIFKMSMKRIAVLTAVHSSQYYSNNSSGSGLSYILQGYNMSSIGNGRSSRFEPDLHGNVNILLGGAMLSGVIMIVVLICYCCHRNVRKHRPQEYSQYWRTEPDVHSLEVFTMDSHAMCYERGIGLNGTEEGTLSSVPRPVTPGPPPAYESLIFNPQNLPSPSDKKESPRSLGNILPVCPESDTAHIKSKELTNNDDEGLPSYEAALKLEASGYV